ncbi:MAG TPA: hypothetical protein VGV93_10005, partial [Acidimicrobiales bacterium]|nr:hypothetical protein [Acidimicrobiales bacterium]
MMRPRLYLLIFAVASGLAGCSGTSDAPTARFTILQHSESGGTSRFEGEGNFATGEVSYALMVEGEPAIERHQIGTETFNQEVGEDIFYDAAESPDT